MNLSYYISINYNYFHNYNKCGKLWNSTAYFVFCGKMWSLKIDKTRGFVPGQWEYGCAWVEVNMLCFQLLVKTLQSQLWRVVVLAQVTQHDVFNERMVDLCDKPGRFHIAKMSERPRDALLQNKGVRALLQHFHVIVRLDDDILRLTDLVLHHLVQHPDICGNRQRMTLIFKIITHGATPVMHHGKRLDVDATDLEILHRFYLMKQRRIHELRGASFPDSLKAVGMGVNRNGPLFCKRLKAFHMVDMVVGDQNRLDAGKW